MSISDERLAEIVAEVGQNSNRMLEHAIFPGWWLEVHLALTELQSLRAAAKVRAIREGAGEWVMVPREPTREMWAAMGDAIVKLGHVHHDAISAAVFAAMIAASPIPATGGEKE